MTMRDRGMLIKGPFTDDDIKILCKVVRAIEQQRPDELFSATILDDEVSMEEAREMVRKTFPKIAGNDVIMGELHFGKEE
jgi:hypothetical protein